MAAMMATLLNKKNNFKTFQDNTFFQDLIKSFQELDAISTVNVLLKHNPGFSRMHVNTV